MKIRTINIIMIPLLISAVIGIWANNKIQKDAMKTQTDNEWFMQQEQILKPK